MRRNEGRRGAKGEVEGRGRSEGEKRGSIQMHGKLNAHGNFERFSRQNCLRAGKTHIDLPEGSTSDERMRSSAE
jgi:hypothetical protein